MKTRSKGSNKSDAGKAKTTESTVQKVQLQPQSSNPPSLFVLPKDASIDARITTISNPRTLATSRYFICPENGFYEFTKISAPRTTPRSWLLAPDTFAAAPNSTEASETPKLSQDSTAKAGQQGYVLKSPDLFVATPIDPLFFLLPTFFPASTSKSSEPTKRLFLSSDDYFDRMLSDSPQVQDFLRVEHLRMILEKRMGAVCDTVEAGDEQMFRVNEEKLVKVLIEKARRMSKNGLPASLEENFVRKPLEPPLLAVKLDVTSTGGVVEKDTSSLSEAPSTPQVDTPESQSTNSSLDSGDSAASQFSMVSEASTSVTTPEEVNAQSSQIDTPESLAELLRLRTALYYICSNYLPTHINDIVKGQLASPQSPIDFAPLNAHLSRLQTLRQEAVAARSIADYTRKRVADDEEEEIRAEKRRKKEEEEKKKKAGESRAIRNLKKVNVSGMKKMSDFFKKK